MAARKAPSIDLGVIGKAQELKKRLWFVVGALIVYRIGTYIPLPGINSRILAELFDQTGGGILDMFNMFSGGALGRMTVFALNIMPYITVSIVMQLMTVISPKLAALKKEGEQLLDFSEEVQQWQNRILSLRRWNPQDAWPEVSTISLLQTNIEWLGPYLTGIKRPDQLKKINLKEVLHYSLSPEQQQLLEKQAPTHITVTSGSKIQLMYRDNGEAPVLAVRIQEVFGLAETPMVNQGKQSILLHLLSPGFKPVQITADLKSFWSDAYFEVKKELKRRYPKHVWPDDPWNEPAIKGVKKRS